MHAYTRSQGVCNYRGLTVVAHVFFVNESRHVIECANPNKLNKKYTVYPEISVVTNEVRFGLRSNLVSPNPL